jgi:hypothetical protein
LLKARDPPISILSTLETKTMAIINGSALGDVISPLAPLPYRSTNLADQIFGNAGDDVIDGGAGNDTIDGGAGNDRIFGGDGNDTLTGGAGVDTIYGGFGNDIITSDGDGGNYYGEAGNDLMKSGLGNEYMDGGVGTDTIDHRAFNGNYDYDMVTGITNFTALIGEQFRNFENALMGYGDDSVTGTFGANSINGGGGNDRLTGGLGVDILTGGAGSDQFRSGEWGGANRDLITDFSVVDDSIVLLDALDAGLPAPMGPTAGGITGLAFNGGSVAGNSLAAGWLFKAAGAVAPFNGMAAGSLSGIYVDTASGDLWYNPTTLTANDSRLLARVSLGAATAMTAADFVYG